MCWVSLKCRVDKRAGPGDGCSYGNAGHSLAKEPSGTAIEYLEGCSSRDGLIGMGGNLLSAAARPHSIWRSSFDRVVEEARTVNISAAMSLMPRVVLPW